MPRYYPADLAEFHESSSTPVSRSAWSAARTSQETLVVDPRCRQSRGSMIDAKVAHVLRLLTASDPPFHRGSGAKSS